MSKKNLRLSILYSGIFYRRQQKMIDEEKLRHFPFWTVFFPNETIVIERARATCHPKLR